LILILAIAVVFQGCSSGRHAHRGKLSDAMERASTDHEGDRRMPEPEHSHEPDPDFGQDTTWEIEIDAPCIGDDCPEAGNDSTDNYPPTDEAPLPDRISEDNDGFYGFSGGVGPMKSEDFAPITRMDIFVGTYIGKHSRWELHLGGSWAPINDTSELDKSLTDGVFLLNAGLDYKWFASSRKVFLTPYVILGGAYNIMWWSYENPIITFDGEKISGDDVDGIEIHAGVGLQLAQTRQFQIGVEVVPSLIIWGPTTGQGFENDVFRDFSLIMFRGTLTVLPD